MRGRVPASVCLDLVNSLLLWLTVNDREQAAKKFLALRGMRCGGWTGEKEVWADAGRPGCTFCLTNSHGHGALCCSKSTYYLSSYKNMYLCIILYKMD